MKRILALMMALAMLLGCGAAVAETLENAVTVEETQTLTSVTGLFTLEIPADYVIVDAALIQIINEQASEEYFTENDVDEDVAQTVLDTMAQLDSSMQDFVYAPDFIANFNALVSPATGLTREMLPMVKSALDESLTAQYAAMLGVAEEDWIPKDLITIGEEAYACYAFEVRFMGNTLHQYITFADDGTQITVSFTAIDEETALEIMNTFAFVEQ